MSKNTHTHTRSHWRGKLPLLVSEKAMSRLDFPAITTDYYISMHQHSSSNDRAIVRLSVSRRLLIQTSTQSWMSSLDCVNAEPLANGSVVKWWWFRASCLYLRCWVRLSLAFFSGRQTGQSCRVQFFQWEMICLDDAQWATAEETQTNEKKQRLVSGFWKLDIFDSNRARSFTYMRNQF